VSTATNIEIKQTNTVVAKPKFSTWLMPKSTFVHDVKWGLCHHGMAHPRVADGGGGLQVWKVAENLLSK
jgi:hypothetical protein